MVIDILLSVVTTALSSSVLLMMQSMFNKGTNEKENNEIKNAVDKTIEQIKNTDNVIELMVKNVAELREYYVISKQQANKAFSSALLVCFLGFIVFISGIFISYISNQNVIIYTTISGGIVEIVSGLFFWLYKNSIYQLNIYHERLGTTEKYLTAMQLIEKMSPDKKDNTYRYLIEVMLIDNSSIVRNKAHNSKENNIDGEVSIMSK